MTTTAFTKPSELRTRVPSRLAGGDNTVPRDGLDRPRIIVPCRDCATSGKVPSTKTNRLVKCRKCSGEGRKLKSFTRTTTFIDVIEDKSNLMAWNKRNVLIGAAMDPTYLRGVEDYAAKLKSEDDEERKKAKDWLNRRAESCAEKAGAKDKAEKGTFLHGLSELVDQGKELPDDVEFGDVIDMDGYRRATEGFKIRHMERLVVLDEFEVAGTPDRISTWVGEEDLVAPDGSVIDRDQLLITDLKTGTVDYGALKMAMQLAIYAHSALYDPATGNRTPLGNINLEWGVIMNNPAGTGDTTLYWADLRMGWEAVHIARSIRQLRSKGKKALSRFGATSFPTSV